MWISLVGFCGGIDRLGLVMVMVKELLSCKVSRKSCVQPMQDMIPASTAILNTSFWDRGRQT
jgi:hypothetical protein